MNFSHNDSDITVRQAAAAETGWPLPRLQLKQPWEMSMAAYLIVHRREITDPQQLKAYANGVQETINKFGGTVVVRADSFKVLEGQWHSGQKANDRMPERITVIEFPDMARLNAWYNSNDYARLRMIRQASAVSDVVAVEGI